MKNVLLAFTVLVFIAGCAGAPPEDPLEPHNRAVFSFNDKLDKNVMKPVAERYEAVTPVLVRTWVSNFFGNLQDPWIAVNSLLQGKVTEAVTGLMRFLFNSTMGLGGLLDISTEAGLPKHDEDFGQTLGAWGVKEGYFIVLPFFGPTTLRDASAMPLDVAATSLWSRSYGKSIIKDSKVRYGLSGLKVINARARHLGAERTLEEGTLDKYRFARDLYLQQRRFRVHDGNPPLGNNDFDLDEDFDAPLESGEEQ